MGKEDLNDDFLNDLNAGNNIPTDTIELNDNNFALDFDIFGEDMGGNNSGIEDLYRIKFQSGINENVKFLGLEWQSDENYKMIKAKFENHDGWEESFPMFIPEIRTYTDEKGKEISTWFPKKMYDSNKMIIEDNSQYRRRHFGGVKVVDDNGKSMKDSATGKAIYRNETESEAEQREMISFKMKLNSFIACFCKDKVRECMTMIASKGRVTGWKDYMERLMEAINTFAPNYQEELIRLKLHRKYDKTTSNGRSEKFFQLPESMEYGLFVEKMCPIESSVITTTLYEEEKLIAAPTKQNVQAGLNANTGGIPKQNMIGAMPIGGNLTGLPQATAMPNLKR